MGGGKQDFTSSKTGDRFRNWYAYYCCAQKTCGAIHTDGNVQACLSRDSVDTALMSGLRESLPTESEEALAKKALLASLTLSPSSFLLHCFSSFDSNWSLNSVMVNVRSMQEDLFGNGNRWQQQTMEEIAYSTWNKQDAFETKMLYGIKWGNWKVPLCIHTLGMFFHDEIDG